jgi:hypothetical protein
MISQITAGVVVTLTIEVSNCGTWGIGCDIAQVHKQAMDGAIGYVKDRCDKDRRIRIIGQPQVRTIITEEIR